MANIVNLTFESGLEHFENWFNAAISSDTGDAHSGTHSLLVPMSDSFTGVDQDNFPYTTGFTAGNSYDFSLWYKEATATMPSVTWSIVWYDSGPAILRTATVTLTRQTAWTKASTTVTAPTGTASMQMTFTTTSGGSGPAYRIDDVLVADTPTGSARALDGISAAAAGATGSLTRSLALSSHGDASAGATGALSRARPVDGIGSAAAGLTGSLVTSLALSSQGDASSALTGSFGLSRAVDSHVDAAAGFVGAVTLARALSAISGASSGATGDLTVSVYTEVLLTGFGGAAAYATGSLGRGRPVDAKSLAASFAAGSLTVTGAGEEAVIYARRPVVATQVSARRPTVVRR